jgi:hypothetical protein
MGGACSKNKGEKKVKWSEGLKWSEGFEVEFRS